ncbi:MAG: ImmA/IrrE family metallo-endopeptidase, partial [Myxococcales bacterium]|nr:ImmA/IrrE family metallo-endopeptidase [Myxococcales bacterium]
RLPRDTPSLHAASWRMESISRLPDATDELDALLADRERWWRRHGLGSALPDYRIPDLHVRRSGTDVELSWDDREWRTVPRGIRLVESPGAVLLPADHAARVVLDWSKSVLEELAMAPEANSVAVELQQRMTAIETGADVLTRLQWAAGPQLLRAAEHLRRLIGITTGTVEDTLRSLLGLTETRGRGPIASLTVPAMLLRSTAPSLSAADVDKLVSLTSSPAADPLPLADWQSHEPPPAAGRMAITEDGYERALDLREALALAPTAPLSRDDDLERVLLPRLGVEVVDIQLDDANVDGVAVLNPGHRPLIAVNLSGRFSRSPWGRRMTLAHELCHLLYDLDESGRVGVVSNPWAPQRMERRANAFAAMLLMPRAAVTARLPDDPRRWTAGLLRDAMQELGVGKSSFTWQLVNLGLISVSERDAWLDEL